jgi:DNA-binding MarR family transcriptional regulator
VRTAGLPRNQAALLAAIHDGSDTPVRAADRLSLDVAKVAKLVVRLSARGLVEGTTKYRLTDEGVKVAKEVATEAIRRRNLSDNMLAKRADKYDALADRLTDRWPAVSKWARGQARLDRDQVRYNRSIPLSDWA